MNQSKQEKQQASERIKASKLSEQAKQDREAKAWREYPLTLSEKYHQQSPISYW
jgi:hypothetical protein